METHWQIGLLGGLRLRAGDREITRFRYTRAGSLLALLAVRPERVYSRQNLMDILWPDSQDASGSLRFTLHSLRRQLQPPGCDISLLLVDRRIVRLNTAVVWTDTAEMERLLRSTGTGSRAKRLQSAVELYRGVLLPEFNDDWVIPERAHFTELHRTALVELTDHFRRVGELDRAVGYAREASVAEPHRDDLFLRFLELLVEAGRTAEAAQEYRWLKRALDRLGSRPSLKIRAFAASLPPKPSSRPRTVKMRSQWVKTSAVRDVNSIGVRSGVSLPLTRLVGREEELTRLRELLCPGDSQARREAPPPQDERRGKRPDQRPLCRLLTVTGPGGVGKSSLAMELAIKLRDHYEKRIWFVPLTGVLESALIPSAVCESLGLQVTPGDDPCEELAGFLSDGPGLLILDNCEHILSTADHCPARDALLRLLALVPELQCLVTSREAMGIPGEQEFPVSPLAYPSACVAMEGAASVPSVKLFVEAARRVRPDFALTKRNATAIAEICRTLDGLPLAIELAAAWSGLLTPAQILQRLPARFTLLVRRSGPTSRHASLREVLQWSFDRLSPEIRRFLLRLCVFRDGFSLAAAEVVCQESMTVGGLRLLQERSLIQVENGEEAIRYRLLESVREFGLELLPVAEWTQLCQAHARYYAELAEQWTREDRSNPDFAQEKSNLHAALDRSGPSEWGVRLAAAMIPFWIGTGAWTDGRHWLERLLKEIPDGPDFTLLPARAGLAVICVMQEGYGAHALDYHEVLECCRQANSETVATVLRVLTHPALFAITDADFVPALKALLRQLPENQCSTATAFLLAVEAKQLVVKGRMEEASSLQERSLALYRTADQNAGVAAVLSGRGNSALYLGNYADARAFWEESLAIQEQLGNSGETARMAGELGYLALRQADFDRAEALFERQLAASRDSRSRRGIASGLWALGNLERQRGNLGRAHLLLEESLAIRRNLQAQGEIADSLQALSTLARSQGQLRNARRFQEEALALRRELPDELDLAMALNGMGEQELAEGKPETAMAFLLESLERCRKIDSKPGIVWSLRSLGLALLQRGELDDARRCLGECHSLSVGMGDRCNTVQCLELLAVVEMEGDLYVQNARRAALLLEQAAAARSEMNAPVVALADVCRLRRAAVRIRTLVGTAASCAFPDYGLEDVVV